MEQDPTDAEPERELTPREKVIRFLDLQGVLDTPEDTDSAGPDEPPSNGPASAA